MSVEKGITLLLVVGLVSGRAAVIEGAKVVVFTT